MPALAAARRNLLGKTALATSPCLASVDAAGWTGQLDSLPASYADKAAIVWRQGFDANGSPTTRLARIPLRGRLRQAATSQGTQASPNYTAAGVTLYGKVYASDVLVGGKPNASTETVPQPICAVVSADRQLVANSVTVEVVAAHCLAMNGEALACLKGVASDQHGVSVTVLASASVATQGAYDLSASRITRYLLTFDITALTDGDAITVDLFAYPWAGGASSVAQASVVNLSNFRAQTYRKHATLAATPVIAYVNTTASASPQVSTSDATAAANYYGTVQAAIDALRASTAGGKAANSLDGSVIKMMAGTHTLGSATTYTDASVTGLVIQAAAGESPSTVTLTTGGTSPQLKCPYIRFQNVKLLRNGTTTLLTGGSTFFYSFEACTLDNASQGFSLTAATTTLRLLGCTLQNLGSALAPFSTQIVALMRGCSGGTNNANISLDGRCVVGCNLTGVTLGISTTAISNLVVGFNRLMGTGSGIAVSFNLTSAGATDQIAVVQNVVEYTSATNAAAMRISGDGNLNNVNHCVILHNSFAGFDIYGRWNIAYDEASGAQRRTHKNWLIAHNIGVSWNSKSDIYVGVNQGLSSESPFRTGAWEAQFGAGARYNFTQFRNSNAGNWDFGPEDAGLGSLTGTSNTTALDPKFVAPAHTTSGPTAGASGGDYHLQSTSPCIGMVPAGAMLLAYDLDGTARKNTGAGAVGAYEG